MLTIILTLALTLSATFPVFAGPIENELEKNASAFDIGFGVKAKRLIIPTEYTTANGKTFVLSYFTPVWENGIKYYWLIYNVEE